MVDGIIFETSFPKLGKTLNRSQYHMNPVKEAARQEATNGKPFKITDGFLGGNNSDKKRLKSIIENLSESFTGRLLLEKAKENNFRIEFAEGMEALGSCDPSKKMIYLNPDNNKDNSTVTLAHELRHSVQFSNGMSLNIDTDDIKTQIQINRAMEADAEAHAGLVAWQLKSNGNDKPWEGFERDAPMVAKALKSEIIKFGCGKINYNIIPEIQSAAFKGWYKDYEVREEYDQQHINLLKEMKDDGIASNLTFDRACNVNIIVSKICRLGNEIYLTDSPEILNTKEMLGISKENINEIKLFFKERKEEYGHDVDASIKEFPVYERTNKKSRKIQFCTKSVYCDYAKKKLSVKRQEKAIKQKRIGKKTFQRAILSQRVKSR
ncbi:MAG: hypothetical protein KAJ75_06720 [Alphaproteobacteria bacterium]|nr:hypothetical protein [Alphaproteobacteria bacterium]